MKRSCLSKMADRPRVLTRSATGLALTTDPARVIWVGKIDTYCNQWALLMEHHGAKAWGLQVLKDTALLDAGWLTDPDIIPTPATWTLETVITGAAYTVITTKIAQTDLTPAFFDGMTFRQMLLALATDLQLAAFDPDTVFA